jgi:molybdopterin molybdotransferase
MSELKMVSTRGELEIQIDMEVEEVTLEQAIDLLLSRTDITNVRESVPIGEAVGRISADVITAPMDQPPFDRSPLDGYTFHAIDTYEASRERPAVLEVIGEICAGDHYDDYIPRGKAVRIMTGAPIPIGCDCVVRQEDVAVDKCGHVLIPMEMHRHQNYCFAGEDIAADAVLIEADERLTAAHIGVLASMGLRRVDVWRRPRIALAGTGDELVEPGQELTAGKIYNSNIYTLAARLQELGFAAQVIGILPDDISTAARVISGHAADTDIFITTGGVSVGKKDIMHGVIRNLQAERIFWRMAIKPGAPVLTYKTDDLLGIALSGNPFAALATFELLVRPVLAQASRNPAVMYHRQQAILDDDFLKVSAGRRFIRGRYHGGHVHLPGHDESGVLFSARHCNALVDIPAGTIELQRGMVVDIVRL